MDDDENDVDDDDEETEVDDDENDVHDDDKEAEVDNDENDVHDDDEETEVVVIGTARKVLKNLKSNISCKSKKNTRENGKHWQGQKYNQP